MLSKLYSISVSFLICKMERKQVPTTNGFGEDEIKTQRAFGKMLGTWNAFKLLVDTL